MAQPIEIPLAPETRDELERLIDHFTLASVLDSLREICDGKAQHIQEQWQDRTTARAWERAAGRLNTLAQHLAKEGL